MFNYHFYEMSLYFPASKVKIKNLAVGGENTFHPTQMSHWQPPTNTSNLYARVLETGA